MQVPHCLFFTCFFQVLFTISLCVDYCKFNESHVLCGEEENFHPRCGDKINYRGYFKKEKEKILKIHNKLRNKVATGSLECQKLKYPEAANMEELVWDEELAKIAGGSVKRCLFDHTCPECRRSSKFENVGENLNLMTTSNNLKRLCKYSTVNRNTAGWVKEKDLFSPNDVHKYPSGSNELGYKSLEYGHFAQMIWANTTNVGCAKIGFVNKNNQSEIIFACLYGDSGNFQDEKVYEKGKHCTKCKGEGRNCSQKYPGLCAAASLP